MKIRPAVPEDIPFILEAHQKIEQERAGLTKDRLIRDVFCKNPKVHICVIEVDNQLVGIALYCYVYWASEGPVLYISQMYIKPEHRGRYFYKLVRWLFQEGKKNHCQSAFWGTHASNERAQKLWRTGKARNLSKNYGFWVRPLS